MIMSKRLSAALAAVSLIAVVTACAGPGSRPRSASIFGDKVDTANIGLATKAQMALASNDVAGAITLAERAVERSPTDAGFRALLGNCYLAAGRFASAEAAFSDSLSLVSAQPQVVLKLALVQIAQGKGDQARGLLASAQGMLDPADTGLALALAGDPQGAIGLLEPAARAIGADSRVRQNLALAHALAGDWGQARLVASQDVPADQLDARIDQWMKLARPARAHEQVASFIGIQPAAADPGQPVRLALHKGQNVRQATAEPVIQPAPMVETVAVAEPAYVPPPAPEPVAVAVAEPVAPPPVVVAEQAPVVTKVGVSPIRQARPALSPAAVRLSESLPSLRRGAAPKARASRSKAVVQLGAFSSRDRVQLAWGNATGKFAALRGYQPVSARFEGAKGTVYRLSVKGFDSDREAINLCEALKRSGRACFVRASSGDAPVRFASRS
ncbi:MAG TPA: tetratricopeptide repeat protein [Sphingomicrobium sp.]|nr:tetratricopeptide repeat protein [Sphingomicrobium sp.]